MLHLPRVRRALGFEERVGRGDAKTCLVRCGWNRNELGARRPPQTDPHPERRSARALPELQGR